MRKYLIEDIKIAIYEYDEKREFIRRTDDADRSSREKEVKKVWILEKLIYIL